MRQASGTGHVAMAGMRRQRADTLHREHTLHTLHTLHMLHMLHMLHTLHTLHTLHMQAQAARAVTKAATGRTRLESVAPLHAPARAVLRTLRRSGAHGSACASRRARFMH